MNLKRRKRSLISINYRLPSQHRSKPYPPLNSQNSSPNPHIDPQLPNGNLSLSNNKKKNGARIAHHVRFPEQRADSRSASYILSAKARSAHTRNRGAIEATTALAFRTRARESQRCFFFSELQGFFSERFFEVCAHSLDHGVTPSGCCYGYIGVWFLRRCVLLRRCEVIFFFKRKFGWKGE